MEKEVKEKLENLLKERICQIFSEITDKVDNYGKVIFTLEVSRLKVAECHISVWISQYVDGKISPTVFIGCWGRNCALDKVGSFDKIFCDAESLEQYIQSDEFRTDIINSNVWKYCTDEEFRKNTIEDYTNEVLSRLENNLIEVLENVGGREVMRILSPLNQFISYGGDFEAVANMVNRISEIMKENRDLKLKLKE